jgi:hypothetical protein
MSGNFKELCLNTPKMLREREVQRIISFFHSFTEKKLFYLMKEKIYSDLQKTINQFSYYDAFTLEFLAQLELKCRKVHFPEMFIEKIKWDKLKKSSYIKALYVNSTSEGIYMWDIKQINENDIVWGLRTMNKETETENGEIIEHPEKEEKLVGYLPINIAEDLTEKLVDISKI